MRLLQFGFGPGGDPSSSSVWRRTHAVSWPVQFARLNNIIADGHATSNAPDLLLPPKLSGAGPGQYWGGGPHGKTVGCCRICAEGVRIFPEGVLRVDPHVGQGRSDFCGMRSDFAGGRFESRPAWRTGISGFCGMRSGFA